LATSGLMHFWIVAYRTLEERHVGSDRGALSASRLVGFPGPPSEPDAQLPLHPALHVFMPLLVQPVSVSHVPATRPPTRSGHGAPAFTSGLRDQQFGCEHTGPLRHVTGFPDLGPLTSGPPPHPTGISRQRAFPPPNKMLASKRAARSGAP